MVFEGEYFFRNILRWNLGWPTPNYAGAFIATILPLCWAWKLTWKSVGRGIASCLCLAVETSLWFVLCKTYSRGALVALIGALAWWYALDWRNRSDARRALISIQTIRVVIVVSLLAITGFVGRLSPAYLQTDGAVGNRLGLWSGGLAMMAAAPVAGWGAGESGRAYMNWYQDLDRLEPYATMVNSYLHIGVERGLLMLGLVAFFIAIPFALATLAVTRGDRLAIAGGGSLCAWAIANAFTTLWIEPKLWLIPGVAIGVLLLRSRHFPITLWRTALASAAAASGLMVAMILSGGTWLLHRQAVRVEPAQFGTVALCHRQGSEGPSETWEAWPDSAILGPMPGKEFRRWFKTTAPTVRLLVRNPTQAQQDANAAHADRLMLFGRHAARAKESFISDCRELCFIHPTVPPPEQQPAAITKPATTVILPAIDETGLNEAWKTWAAQTGARLLLSPRSGLDIRSVWPDVAATISSH